jgi:hypothetical protein
LPVHFAGRTNGGGYLRLGTLMSAANKQRGDEECTELPFNEPGLRDGNPNQCIELDKQKGV